MLSLKKDSKKDEESNFAYLNNYWSTFKFTYVCASIWKAVDLIRLRTWKSRRFFKRQEHSMKRQ